MELSAINHDPDFINFTGSREAEHHLSPSSPLPPDSGTNGICNFRHLHPFPPPSWRRCARLVLSVGAALAGSSGQGCFG